MLIGFGALLLALGGGIWYLMTSKLLPINWLLLVLSLLFLGILYLADYGFTYDQVRIEIPFYLIAGLLGVIPLTLLAAIIFETHDITPDIKTLAGTYVSAFEFLTFILLLYQSIKAINYWYKTRLIDRFYTGNRFLIHLKYI